jgi:hypothetical protein
MAFSSLCQLAINFSTPLMMTGLITPLTRQTVNMEERASKCSHLNSPMSLQAIVELRDPMIESDGVDKGMKGLDEVDDGDEDEEVESNKTQLENELLANEMLTNDIDYNPADFNLLIPEKYFATFIRDNFSYKQCHAPIKERNISGTATTRTVKVLIY